MWQPQILSLHRIHNNNNNTSNNTKKTTELHRRIYSVVIYVLSISTSFIQTSDFDYTVCNSDLLPESQYHGKFENAFEAFTKAKQEFCLVCRFCVYVYVFVYIECTPTKEQKKNTPHMRSRSLSTYSYNVISLPPMFIPCTIFIYRFWQIRLCVSLSLSLSYNCIHCMQHDQNFLLLTQNVEYSCVFRTAIYSTSSRNNNNNNDNNNNSSNNNTRPGLHVL